MVRAFRPESVNHALEIMSENQVIPLAGGTDLMVQRRAWSGLPPRFELPVLFIDHLEELQLLRKEEEQLRICAGCTFTSLLEHEAVPWEFKIVIAQIACPQIRNRGTIGGNICNASPAGDTLPLLYAFDAELALVRKNDSRKLPIEEFLTGPGQTVLEKDEILKEIVIPVYSFNTFFYRKVGARRANSCSKLSFTGCARVDGNKITDIRMSFGAVAPTIVRSREIEARLRGKTGKELNKLIPEIIDLYAELIKPIEDQRCTIRYRKTISLKLLHHFLGDVIMAKMT